MPVKWRSRGSNRGVVRSTLADSTGSVAGAYTVPPTFNGRINGLVYDFTGSLAGTYQVSAQRAGVISTTLAGCTGSINGGANAAPQFTTSASLSAAANQPFTLTLSATDPDTGRNQPLTFTRTTSLPGGVTETINAQSGDTRTITLASSAGLAAGTYTVAYDVDDGWVTATADWQARSTASGVLWSHDFSNQREVDKFRWKNGYGNQPSEIDGSVTWLQGGGPNGVGGAIRMKRPRTDSLATNPLYPSPALSSVTCGWVRPMSPLPSDGILPADRGYSLFPATPNYDPTRKATGETWADGFYSAASIRTALASSYRYHGDEFWISFKVRIDPTRATATQDANSRPNDFLKFWSLTDRTGGANYYNFLCDTNHIGSYYVYTGYTSQYPAQRSNPADPVFPSGYSNTGTLRDAQFSLTGATGGVLQNQSPYAACTTADYRTAGDPACWFWPFGQWVTVMMHVTCREMSTTGLSGTYFPYEWIANGTGTLEIAVWQPGMTDWLYLFKKYNWNTIWNRSLYLYRGDYTFDSGAVAEMALPNGYGSFLLSNYIQEITYNDSWTDVSHIIFSQQAIAAPTA